MARVSKTGMIVDVVSGKIFPGTIHVEEGKIVAVESAPQMQNVPYILPGFVDAHVHIESSMLIPSEFARLASVHGTVATVSDPHEIANVLGVEGIRYMIENSRKVPFHFYFGASSCVPATNFETAGATLTAAEIEELFVKDELKYLSEMMNYPGVLHKDPIVMEKIAVAKKHRRPIDGHAPGLRGEECARYIAAGISTDHECFTLDEAKEKAAAGMHIIIREGSAAKNFEALHPLFNLYPTRLMFCSDDKHPDALVEGHIDELVKRSIALGYDTMAVLRAATLNPVKHYGLDVGLLQPGDSGDFIVVDNLRDFNVSETYVNGICIAENGKTHLRSIAETTPNKFACSRKKAEDFVIKASSPSGSIRVIKVEDGQLVTKDVTMEPLVVEGNYVADPSRDLLKLVVVNRYEERPPAIAFVTNFGLKKGAIASCVAHDSHNIIAVGCNDRDIAAAVNLLIDQRGGIAAVAGEEKAGLALPVAGIMSNEDGYVVSRHYAALDAKAKAFGSSLHAPFMTLSFLALLVIPELKLSDRGLFDARKFAFVFDL